MLWTPGGIWTPKRHSPSLVLDLYTSITAKKAWGTPTHEAYSRSTTAYRDYWSGTSRLIESVAIDTHRKVHRKDKNGLSIYGWLGELAETNICLRNEEIDHGTWAKVGCTITNTSTVTWPNSVTSSYDVIHEATSANAYINQNINWSAGKYLAYAFAKKINRYWFQIRLREVSTFKFAKATFNLNTGQVGSLGLVGTNGIMPYGNGIYLCWVAGVCVNAGVDDAYFLVCDDDDDISFTGLNQDSLFCWGANVVAGIDHPGSYIKTIGSPVSRGADSAIQYAGLANFGDQNRKQGTIVFPLLMDAFTPLANIDLFKVSDGGSVNDMIKGYIDTSGRINAASACSGGTAGSSLATGSVCTNEKKYIIARWKEKFLDTIVVDAKTRGVTHGTPHTGCNIADELDRFELLPCGGVMGELHYIPYYEHSVSTIMERMAA